MRCWAEEHPHQQTPAGGAGSFIPTPGQWLVHPPDLKPRAANPRTLCLCHHPEPCQPPPWWLQREQPPGRFLPALCQQHRAAAVQGCNTSTGASPGRVSNAAAAGMAPSTPSRADSSPGLPGFLMFSARASLSAPICVCRAARGPRWHMGSDWVGSDWAGSPCAGAEPPPQLCWPQTPVRGSGSPRVLQKARTWVNPSKWGAP